MREGQVSVVDYVVNMVIHKKDCPIKLLENIINKKPSAVTYFPPLQERPITLDRELPITKIINKEI